MTIQPDAPADTRMMRIVHQALRRDVGRAQAALTSTPPPSPQQQHAIGRHVTWMMSFLRAHHRSEDEGLYPVVRERDPAAAELLDAMNAEHEAVASTIADVEAGASSFGSGDTGGSDRPLAAALERLGEVLLPHLQREEDEVMPVVSSVVTNGEWRALEEEYNLEPKSFVQLGREGHWLIDDASPEDRQAVVGLVPALPRFILLHGFARSYRRRAAACWGRPARPKRRVQKRGRCEVCVDADIDAVWDVVRDVTRVGEWSHECVSVGWLGGATSATPGARFQGRNHSGIFRWGRVCEIVAAEPYELVWRTVPTGLYPDSTEWRIRLCPADTGTQIEQTFTVLRGPKLLDLLYGLAIPAHRDRTAALTNDLRRLGHLAVDSPRTAPEVAPAQSTSRPRTT
jgi:hemerythrin-like domain-containing protein